MELIKTLNQVTLFALVVAKGMSVQNVCSGGGVATAPIDRAAEQPGEDEDDEGMDWRNISFVNNTQIFMLSLFSQHDQYENL